MGQNGNNAMDYSMGTSETNINQNTNGNSLSTLKTQAVEQGSALLDQGKQVAGQAIDSAKGQVMSQLSTQKDRATDSLSSAVRALEATGQQFRDNDLGFVAGYADNLTGQVRQFSDYLQNKDIDELARDVEGFARRNPAVFIGGAFLLGAALARFLKSSNASMETGYGSSQALVPIDTSNNLPARLSDTASFTARQADLGPDPTFGERPMTAHDYVPGIGTRSVESNI